MDDDGLSDDLIHPEAARQHGHFGSALMGKQGRQVPGVVRVGLTGGVIVGAAFGEVLASTAAAFVDMESVKAVPGQAPDLCRDQNTAAVLTEPDGAH